MTENNTDNTNQYSKNNTRRINSFDQKNLKNRSVLSVKPTLSLNKTIKPNLDQLKKAYLNRKNRQINNRTTPSERRYSFRPQRNHNNNALTDPEIHRRMEALQRFKKESAQLRSVRQVNENKTIINVEKKSDIKINNDKLRQKINKKIDLIDNEKVIDIKIQNKNSDNAKKSSNGKKVDVINYEISDIKSNISDTQAKFLLNVRKKIDTIDTNNSLKQKDSLRKKRVFGRKDRRRVNLNDDGNRKQRSIAALKRTRLKKRNSDIITKPKIVKTISWSNNMDIKTLAHLMNENVKILIKQANILHIEVSKEKLLDHNIIELLILELGHIPNYIKSLTIENLIEKESSDQKELIDRAPIIAVAGHIDHGKTTLLNSLKNINIIEAGGITQHISAYEIYDKDKKMVFIDTPGHEAFTNLKNRGINIADIILLIIAADSGVQKQTIETIKGFKKSNIPCIVVINKIDLPNSNPKQIKETLLEHDIVVEEYGGDVLCVEISAAKKSNLEELKESILILAETLQLKTNPNAKAHGIILESRIDVFKGVIMDVLLQHGNLTRSDLICTNSIYGKIRTIYDCHNKVLKSVFASTPIQITGFVEPGKVGELFIFMDEEKYARKLINNNLEIIKANQKDSFIDYAFMGDVKLLNIILITDTWSSLEAVKGLIDKIKHKQIRINIISSHIGIINGSDIQLAQQANAVIYLFHIAIPKPLLHKINNANIRYYHEDIIYNLEANIKTEINKLLPPIITLISIGKATVIKVFQISKIGNIAGCIVNSGIVKLNSVIKLFRKKKMIYKGTIVALKKGKNDATEVGMGVECGVLLSQWNDIEENDTLEIFKKETKQVTI